MKVKKINNINGLGQFNNFKWPTDLPEFKKYNFFYGWNCSGKTTLSRLFRFLELKQMHNDYQSATFKIETNNGELTERSLNVDYPIRVFNEDYIEDNFDWNNENSEIEPVLILGKESKELEEQLKQKQKEKSDKEIELKKIEDEKESTNRAFRALDNKLTNKASEIRSSLLITNQKEFDKIKLQEAINSIKDNFQEKVLSNEEVHNNKSTLNSPKLENVSPPKINLKLTEFLDHVKTILEKKVSVQKIIEKIKQNPRLSDWVREGIELHKEETTCQFCGNTLTTERIEELRRYFSKEFDDLITTIKQKENEINNHLNEIDRYSLPDKARFYADFQNKYENLSTKFNQLKSNYIEIGKKLIEELNKKKEKPFEQIIIEQSINDTIENKLNELIKTIQELTVKHNNIMNSLEEEKQKAKEKLKFHYTAQFIQDENYFGKRQEIENLNSEINKLNNEISEISKEIIKIEDQIKAYAIGAQKLNNLLNKFFNDDRLKIEKTSNGRYKLYRNNQIAKNLSTGERNIISLVYFFAKLEETNFDLSQAVIFIDDPVSSLDSNHIHSVYAFLSEKIKNINQIFITTHNFEFFNLLKDMYRYDLQNQNGNFYLIKAITNNHNRYSTMEKLPDILLKFKSEYNYLFYKLKEFNDTNDKNNFDQLYLLPNILRRFFEMYLFMRYPDGKKFNEKANKFFGNNTNNEKVMALKIMDEYSHEENPEHSQRFPDITELEKSIKFILSEIEKSDKNHFDALVDSCK
jgi:wobble nucleotide-excising tRNase